MFAHAVPCLGSLLPDPSGIPCPPLKSVLAGLPEPQDAADAAQRAFSAAKRRTGCQGQTEVDPDGLAPTMRSEHHGNIEFRRHAGGRWTDEAHLPERRLTVREAARIQGFPDSYELVGEGLSATDGYRLVGNAVAPPVAHAVATQLAASVFGLLACGMTDAAE